MSAWREARLERRAIRTLERSSAMGCAGPPAAVAPALAAAGLPALSSVPPGAASTSSGPSASLRTHSSPRRRGGGNLKVAPSEAHTERAQTGTSFPSAVVTALLGLLLAIAMVVVPKLRHRTVLVPAGPIGARSGSAQTQAAPTPGATSGTDSIPASKNETADRAFRAQVPPMDSAIAPMAGAAFSRMANDADHTPEPQTHPRTEDESGDQGDAD